MQKRIFLNFVGLILIFVVLLALSFGLLFFSASQTHEMAGIRDKAHLVSEFLNQGIFEYDLESGDTRITVISSDGWVLSDSHAWADFDDNRSDRSEFIQAIFYGSGEAIRRSDTLGTETFYYAIRLENGNVLRLSRTLYSLGEVFTSTLPALIALTVVILVIAHFTALRLTRKIIKPLTEVDFENIGILIGSAPSESLYEELWPYIRKIELQRLEIEKQLSTLRSRTETIEAIISNMREGLVILDEKELVLAANKSVLEIFTIPKGHDVIQKSIQHIYRDPEFMQTVKECLDGEYLETSFTREDKVYNVFLSPVFTDGSNRGAIIFFLDSTEQFRADRQRREFSANVSHELKTPLTTISALSEMIASGMAKAEDVATFSGKISDHSKRLINIIDDIIRLSEFDEKKALKEFVEVDIFELAATVIATLQEKAIQKSVSLKLIGKPLIVRGNVRLLDELMYNLIDNGIKYNKEGGNVTLTLCEEDVFCTISVADTGIGIPKEYQDRVFERFYRVDSSRSKKTGGTGLGLSIVKHIAEHHGGRVVLESTEGVCTTIVCSIVK